MWVYILASQKNGTVYVGVTAQLAKRIGEHRQGTGSLFAAKHRVFRLVHAEKFDDPLEAISHEKRLKRAPRLEDCIDREVEP